MDTILITMAITLLVVSALAALPLLRLRQAQAVLQGTFGSLCLAVGCGTFFAMCSGMFGNLSGANVLAADSGAKEAAKEIEYAACASSGKEIAKDLPTAPQAGNPSLATPVTKSPSTDESTFFAKLPEGQLHTAPQVTPERPVIPAGRPEWVGRNIMVGSEHSIAVNSSPYATEALADRELDNVIKAKTDEYIAEQLGSTLAPQLIRYDAPAIKRELIHQPIYHELGSFSVGPMHQAHALIEFGPDFRKKITDKWVDLTAYYRLMQTGLIAGGALLFLGTIFSYFRLDTATRGYYTGRLQFMTAAAILAIVGSGAVLARWIYWL